MNSDRAHFSALKYPDASRWGQQAARNHRRLRLKHVRCVVLILYAHQHGHHVRVADGVCPGMDAKSD